MRRFPRWFYYDISIGLFYYSLQFSHSLRVEESSILVFPGFPMIHKQVLVVLSIQYTVKIEKNYFLHTHYLLDNERCTNPKRVLHNMNPWKQLPCSAIVIFLTKNIKISCKSYSSSLAIQAQASASARALWCWVRSYPQ